MNCTTAMSPDGCPEPCKLLAPVVVMDSFKVPLERSGRSALELEDFVQANIFMKSMRQNSF